MARILQAAAVVLAVANLAAADSLSTLDAKVVTGQVVAISAEGVTVQEGTSRQSVPRQEVAEILMAESGDAMTQTAMPVVLTSGGATLATSNLKISEGKAKFGNWLLGPATLDIAAVSTVYFPAAGRNANDVVKICNDLKLPSQAMDILVVRRKAGDYMFIDGVLKELSSDSAIFTWKKEDRKIERPTIVAIRLASTATTRPAPASAGVLRGTKDGSFLPFSALTLAKGEFKLTVPHVGEVSIKRSSVATIEFFSDRVVNLSSLAPVDVKEHGFFDKTFNYRRNLAVDGGPLRLGGETYLSGLGVHSHCELTYKIDAAYATLVMLAGIDDAVRPGGNARLTILGDGKPLDKPLDLTGKSEPVQVRVKVAGVKQLTIRVDFGGDGLDVADHVDLAAARLVK